MLVGLFWWTEDKGGRNEKEDEWERLGQMKKIWVMFLGYFLHFVVQIYKSACPWYRRGNDLHQCLQVHTVEGNDGMSWRILTLVTRKETCSGSRDVEVELFCLSFPGNQGNEFLFISIMPCVRKHWITWAKWVDYTNTEYKSQTLS